MRRGLSIPKCNKSNLNKRTRIILKSMEKINKNFIKIDRLGGGFGTSQGLKCRPRKDQIKEKLTVACKKFNLPKKIDANDVHYCQNSRMLSLNCQLKNPKNPQKSKSPKMNKSSRYRKKKGSKDENILATYFTNELAASHENESISGHRSKSKNRPNTSLIYRSASRMHSPGRIRSSISRGYETERKKKKRIKSAVKFNDSESCYSVRVEKTPDDLNSQNTAYYNDFMESKTKANKLLRLQASRSSMPGHGIKVTKKRWDSSWKKKIDITETKLFTDKSIVNVISDPIIYNSDSSVYDAEGKSILKRLRPKKLRKRANRMGNHSKMSLKRGKYCANEIMINLNI
ncbi:unnamed protein product [Moneuplotes crassus]|uniref:Uncharacterized protein n=1 Tax=Euplotes crassus TaxID=5936 RepID=A0AAD1UPJ1_EUPCR|nr:unnamed protein product [Moneuplotes crassus]